MLYVKTDGQRNSARKWIDNNEESKKTETVEIYARERQGEMETKTVPKKAKEE